MDKFSAFCFGVIVSALLAIAFDSAKPRAPETVPCKCTKCSAQCCEVGK